MMEPYVSWLSFPVYRFLHDEGMAWSADPFQGATLNRKEPFEGNQAIPTLIFGKQRERFTRAFPDLKITQQTKMDILVYPLSGGFHHLSLCPKILWSVLEFCEDLLKPFCEYLAFRLFLVLEKRRNHS